MALNDAYKTDLAFTNDLQVSSTGDFDTISGTANVKAAIMRRIMTVPGSLAHRPGYGCGLISFQNAPMSLAVRRQLAGRIAEQLPQDPRVLAVKSVGISAQDDAEPSTIRVSVVVELVGAGEVTFTYTPFSEVVIP